VLISVVVVNILEVVTSYEKEKLFGVGFAGKRKKRRVLK